MKSLYDYGFLQNNVFYRSEFILKYLERHQDITDLDKKAIANTILDALVTKGLIDPSTQSLDLDNLAITDDLDHIVYSETPNVSSIPLSIKEKMRQKCVRISASIPISIFCSKPAGPTRMCISDMNTALSALFTDFRFLVGDYDSPTRMGIRATERPFIEININGEDYLVDLLTKRIFKSSWFKEKYNMDVTRETFPTAFTPEQREYYDSQIIERQDMASYLLLMENLRDVIKTNPKMEEILYEIDQSKIYFPEAFEELDSMKADMRRLGFMDDILKN